MVASPGTNTCSHSGATGVPSTPAARRPWPFARRPGNGRAAGTVEPTGETRTPEHEPRAGWGHRRPDRGGRGGRARALAPGRGVGHTSTASTLDEALQGAIDLACEHTGWPLGHAFRSDEHTGTLVSAGVGHDDEPDRYRPFVEASAAMTVGLGVGLPGRVVAERRPAWIADVRRDPDFPRRDAAARSGIVAGFGLPMRPGVPPGAAVAAADLAAALRRRGPA